MESTTPVAAPANATSGSDFDPISSSCRNSSRNSNGGVTAARTTRQKKMPRSPNHSKNSPMYSLEEFTAGDAGTARCTGRENRTSPTGPDFASLTGLDLDLALHDDRSGACEKEM